MMIAHEMHPKRKKKKKKKMGKIILMMRHCLFLTTTGHVLKSISKINQIIKENQTFKV